MVIFEVSAHLHIAHLRDLQATTITMVAVPRFDAHSPLLHVNANTHHNESTDDARGACKKMYARAARGCGRRGAASGTWLRRPRAFLRLFYTEMPPAMHRVM